MLQDSGRLIARSRPLASSVRVLGIAPAPGTQDAPPAAAAAAGVDDAGRLSDAYDDSDFYQHLLNQLLASGGAAGAEAAAGGVGAAGGVAGLKPYARRVRPNVDRRATKARRMKFTAIPKLVAFAAPAPFVVPPELAVDVDTVVASLFRAGGE